MATSQASGTSSTVLSQETEPSETLKLKLTKKNKKKIQWTEDTVDNEGMGKKKSKCCCQFTKARTSLEESSSESEEECDHCPGH